MTNEWSFMLAIITAFVTAVAGGLLAIMNSRGQHRLDREQQDLKETARRTDLYISEERLGRAQEVSAATSLRHELRNDNQVLRIEISNLRIEFDVCRKKFTLAEHKLWTLAQELNVLRRQLGLAQEAVNPEPTGDP